MKNAEDFMVAPFCRITQVSVKGLFGLYDHVIDLKLEDHITIIHGPNGVGKTALLKMISNLFAGRYFELAKVPFSRFDVKLNDGSEISTQLIKDDKNKKRNKKGTYSHGQLKIVLSKNGESKTHDIEINPAAIVRIASQINRSLAWTSRVDDDTWLDLRSGEPHSAEEMIFLYGDRIPENLRETMVPEPDWLSEFRAQVKVYLVETQRLFKISTLRRGELFSIEEKPHALINATTVKSYATDLKKIISQTLAQYASKSQSLDQTFPQRLLNDAIVRLDIQDLKTQMTMIENRRSELIKIGLVSEKANDPFNVERLDSLEAAQQTAMTLYVRDTGEKFNVLDDLTQRILLLQQIVNSKFKNKQINISIDEGFIAISKEDEVLDLEALSSGEQHELILAYDLLFKVKQNSLVMIDEPELSLHVTWQKAFLPDLLNIVSATQFDVVLATHSPFIAGERNDLMVPLRADAE